MEYKKYKIESDGVYSMYKIKPQGRGSVPKELSGAYTSTEAAMKAIDFTENKKESGNGKKDSDS